MPNIRGAAVRTGIAGGVLFFLHALVPNSQAYPLVWPALAGAVAFWIATSDAAPRRFRRGVLAALVAGIVVGLVGFVGSTVTVLVLSRPVLNPVAQALGAPGASLATLAAELGLAIVAVVAVGAALVGGAAMIPVRWASSSPPKAPRA
jgi:hypothetical protein